MFTNKPYLVRAFYQWIIDNRCTPYLVLNALYPRCQVPQSFVENGEITLNIAPTAAHELKISNNFIEFRAAFSGVVHIISAPIQAILALYAEENKQGLFFDFEEEAEGEQWPISPKEITQLQPTTLLPKEKRPSHLRLIDEVDGNKSS